MNTGEFTQRGTGSNRIPCPRCGKTFGLGYRIRTLGRDGSRWVTVASRNTDKGVTCRSCAEARLAELDARRREAAAADLAATYQVLADGQPWIDADGLDEWDSHEVWALAESLERRGYLVEVVPA